MYKSLTLTIPELKGIIVKQNGIEIQKIYYIMEEEFGDRVIQTPRHRYLPLFIIFSHNFDNTIFPATVCEDKL